MDVDASSVATVEEVAVFWVKLPVVVILEGTVVSAGVVVLLPARVDDLEGLLCALFLDAITIPARIPPPTRISAASTRPMRIPGFTAR